MVRQGNAEVSPTPQERQEISYIERRTNIKVWFVEAAEEFKGVASRPTIQVQVMFHGGGLTRIFRSMADETGLEAASLCGRRFSSLTQVLDPTPATTELPI